MSYATKPEIVTFMKFFKRNYSVNDVDDLIVNASLTDVISELESHGVDYPADDWCYLLKFAQICFWMELSGMLGQAEFIYGDVERHTIGNFTQHYNNNSPMFFFAQGGNEGFMRLLPHESWKVRGQRLLSRYATHWKRENSNNKSMYAQTSGDDTARGVGWKEPPSDVRSSEDKWYGATLY